MECGSGKKCGNCGNLCPNQLSLFGTSIEICEISGNAVTKDEAGCEFWCEEEPVRRVLKFTMKDENRLQF